MPDIASVLKAEIARLARKEVKALAGSTKRTHAQQRSEIAALKRRVQELERSLGRLARESPKRAEPKAQGADDDSPALRFSAKGLASQRQRLGLSAEDFGKLLGASALSVYKWESGKARPRARFLPAIAAVRTIGKREAARRLGQE